MSAFTVQTQQAPPPPPSRQELEAALERYQRRIPAQEARIGMATFSLAAATRALASADAELTEATAARARLSEIITDYTKKLEG